MSRSQEQLKRLEQKLEKLKELKRKIKQKLKKEKYLANIYAKEVIYYFCSVKYSSKNQDGKVLKQEVISNLLLSLCGRAKHKKKCLKTKLELIVEFAENQFAKNVAKEILEEMES